LELTAFSLAYLVIPNRRVGGINALAGGVLATLLFEWAKTGFAFYLRRCLPTSKYTAHWRSCRFSCSGLPVLAGCFAGCFAGSVALVVSLSAGRSSSAKGYELYGLLRVLARFSQAQQLGRGLHTLDLRSSEPTLSDDQLMWIIELLARHTILQRMRVVRGY
jgi:membrane protein